MKAALPFAALFVGATALAFAPSLKTIENADTFVRGRKVGHLPTVDETSTRGQWVSSYSNDKQEAGEGTTVDRTSTRSQWVTSYSNDKQEAGGDWGHSNHWLPTGPGYLDVDTLETGYHAHLMLMVDSSNWIQSKVLGIKRFLGIRNV